MRQLQKSSLIHISDDFLTFCNDLKSSPILLFFVVAAKRYLDESEHERRDDEPTEKRPRKNLSLASVVERVLMLNNMQIIAAAIEPMLRRVVCEEIEEGLRRRSFKLTKSQSLRIHGSNSSLRLAFSTAPSLRIFTDTKITTIDGTPLRIHLLGQDSSNPIPFRIKLQLLVLDGDFPQGNKDSWTTDEFDRKIVKERAGKRPLLAGEMNLIMRDGVAVAVGDLEFTDNSSWIRSRRFRIGVRVAPGSNCGGVRRIVEGFTDAFVVKDHRGELYKKHHPPMLDDEVWRLEKIGKDGAFHKKLASNGISNVQDFLRLYVTDQTELRKILDSMSDKMWNVTIKHAEECVMSNKQYIYQYLPNCSITFNPVCQIIKAEIDGKLYYAPDLHGLNKAYVQNLAKMAYKNWDSLEVVEEGLVNCGSLMLTQGHLRHVADNDSPLSNHQMSAAIMQFPQQQQHQLVRADHVPYEITSSSSLFLNKDNKQINDHNWIDNYETLLYDDPDGSEWTDKELTHQMMPR